MKILVVGRGTIGITYAYLLSKEHIVHVLEPKLQDQTPINITLFNEQLNLLKKEKYMPYYAEQYNAIYDLVIIAVNRMSVIKYINILKQQNCNCHLLILGNNYEGRKEIEKYYDNFTLGFPRNIGGGRVGKNKINAIVFSKGKIILEDMNNRDLDEHILKSLGATIRIEKRFSEWIKVHYLMQAISIGLFIDMKNKGLKYPNLFVLKRYIKAYRDGLQLCMKTGVRISNMWPEILLFLPWWIIGNVLKKMFADNTTQWMITEHYRHGYNEWIYAYYEILKKGKSNNLKMKNWSYYNKIIEKQQVNP